MELTDAVILAAGLGTRMRPLTDTIPKPLVKVIEKPMIETIIDGLNCFGINNIYIVIGYLGDQFRYLKDKYKNVILIENNEYLEKNNISSLYAVKDIFGENNCFVCEGDLFVGDSDIFNINHNKSFYMGKYTKGETDDWCFIMDEDRVTKITVGGNDIYRMAGISYWKKEDACVIRDSVINAYDNPEHTDLFWDEIVDRELENIMVGIKAVTDEQIVEIDTLEELDAIRKLALKNN